MKSTKSIDNLTIVPGKILLGTPPDTVLSHDYEHHFRMQYAKFNMYDYLWVNLPITRNE